jgi:hypothetical protein
MNKIFIVISISQEYTEVLKAFDTEVKAEAYADSIKYQCGAGDFLVVESFSVE